MSTNNPSVTASDIITDVEARLYSPNISSTVYLPWVSYAYQKLFAALASTNQRVRENLFGNLIQFDLIGGTAEYALSTYIPRFGSFIKGEIRYGASGDDWVRLKPLGSIANWEIQNNVSTSYRPKTGALYYLLEDAIGFVPTPPSGDSGTPTVKIWYVRRPYQINLGTDVIDIDYRFIYPITDYVQAKAIEREAEDYAVAGQVDAKFERQLEEVAQNADAEFNENEIETVYRASDSPLYSDPLRYG